MHVLCYSSANYVKVYSHEPVNPENAMREYSLQQERVVFIFESSRLSWKSAGVDFRIHTSYELLFLQVNCSLQSYDWIFRISYSSCVIG